MRLHPLPAAERRGYTLMIEDTSIRLDVPADWGTQMAPVCFAEALLECSAKGAIDQSQRTKISPARGADQGQTRLPYRPPRRVVDRFFFPFSRWRLGGCSWACAQN